METPDPGIVVSGLSRISQALGTEWARIVEPVPSDTITIWTQSIGYVLIRKSIEDGEMVRSYVRRHEVETNAGIPW